MTGDQLRAPTGRAIVDADTPAGNPGGGVLPGADVDAAVPHAFDAPAQEVASERRSTYAQRLERRAVQRRSCLCVGLDPAPGSLELLEGSELGTRARRAAAIERFCAFVIESARDNAVAVKPQLAWFEAAGVDGMRALERTIAYARTAGLLVVLDAKRGDVSHTATAYAQAWLGADADSGCGGDALTINVSLGPDTLEAFTEVARARHAQVYALVHTSNPGAPLLQGLPVVAAGDLPEEPWWHRVARAVEHAGAGAVVGATHPAALARARTLLPTAPLLVPGVGAQGGTIDDLAPLRAPQAPPPLVAVARGVLPPSPQSGAAFRSHVAAQVEQLALASRALLADA